MSAEKGRNAVNHAWGIDATRSAVHYFKILSRQIHKHVHLPLEFLHDIKKAVVNIRLLGKLHLDVSYLSRAEEPKAGHSE